MQITNLSAKNFYSFEDLHLDFRYMSGLTQIKGRNIDSGGSNGSGKSVIVEAVVFGLFGKTVRKSNEESMVNTKIGEGLKVEISLIVDKKKLIITRCRRPTSLIFLINGKNKNKENAAETQKYIEEVIQADYKSFLASVVFGQHAEVDFLSSSPEEKRNIIRNCFNLEDIFNKRDSVKELKSSAIGEHKALTAVLASLKQDQIKLGKLIPDKKYKYVELPPLQEILEAEKRIGDLSFKISDTKSCISKIKKSLQKINESLQKGKYKETKECPICKNQYEVVQGSTEVKDLELKSKELIDTVLLENDKVQECEKEREEIKPFYSSDQWAKFNEKNRLVSGSQSNIDNFNSMATQILDIGNRLTALESEIEVMKFWEKAFSEQGVIRYIIRNILEYFNLKSNEYLSILTNNQFSIDFSDNLSEIIANNCKEVKFISLSGGEKRKVNLAVMLALQDLQQKISRVKSNLIFFDEVGENLDNISMEAIFALLNILQNQDDSRVIFVITHNNYLNSLFSDLPVVKIEKRKGISKIDGCN